MESKHGFPVVLGHEATGIVKAVGSKVQGFAEGNRVVVTAITPCLSCERCLEGSPYLCDRSWDVVVTHPLRRGQGQPVHAFFGIGSLSEFVIVPATAAVSLPDDIPWPLAALLACGGQTGLGSALQVSWSGNGRGNGRGGPGSGRRGGQTQGG
jgi:S-(hydroxymethyl)glutathione dehydrogenase/alcohol dehydrogenase